jgi:hypothetical protein
MVSSPTLCGPPPPSLSSILDALGDAELERLVARYKLKIDPAKRVSPRQQLARFLVTLPELRAPAQLGPASVSLLHRIADAFGVLGVAALATEAQELCDRALIFLRGDGPNQQLLMPAAYFIQLPPWASEHPCGLRALLANTSAEVQLAVASHYLGHRAIAPLALALEPAWAVLSTRARLEVELRSLSDGERAVLERIGLEGGEVDTEELLELEREPMRMRMASGALPSRRGIGSALERRGLLIPVRPNRHIVPAEVSQILSERVSALRAEQQSLLSNAVAKSDDAPKRARFAQDPAPFALALALEVRATALDLKTHVGMPKSAITRLSQRFGHSYLHTALLASLMRAEGLLASGPPLDDTRASGLRVRDLGAALFALWRRGGAWDEAREEPDVLRLAEDARDLSPVASLREMVIDALTLLGQERWITWSQLALYLEHDARLPGITRLFRRWSERIGVSECAPMATALRIVRESLPALGFLDVSHEKSTEQSTGTTVAFSVRLTPRGRGFQAASESDGDSHSSASCIFIEPHVLRITPSTQIVHVLAVGPCVEVGNIDATLEVLITQRTIAKALAAGYAPSRLRHLLERLAPLPLVLSEYLDAADRVTARCDFVPALGFLWIENPSVRETLRVERSTALLFVDPSPAGGLLVASGTRLETLTARARALGIEVRSMGKRLRAHLP